MTSHTCTCVLYNQNNLILTDKNNKELNGWITDFDSSKFKQSFIQSLEKVKLCYCKCGGIVRNEIW